MSDKKGAVGPDGLTKKERRALKVQSKQVESTPVKNEPAGGLTEKEKRKLEWEKKLAEQNKDKAKDEVNKAELKKLRREQQEAQRLAKTVKQPQSQTPVKVLVEKVESTPQKPDKTPPKKTVKKEAVKKATPNNKVQLVQHLYSDDLIKSEYGSTIVNYKNVHPAFIRLGVQYSTKTILGSNARCLALLSALKQLVEDLQTPPKQEFCRYLENVLQSCTNYLQKCRPSAVSMTNALRHFKLQLTHINNKLTDNEKKAKLVDVIETYINDDIKKAGEAISLKVKEKITNGDVILTYGCSSLIRKILLEAHFDGKRFEVIVVDGRPLLEGRELLRRLVEAGIKCTYVLINSISYVMQDVSKVLLGSHAILTNGYVMSRIGTAQVALVANAFNKPVLVCCETYKFSEKVQMDAFVYNEVGEENALIKIDNRENGKLLPLNLLYDVTPPEMVTAVVTEIAILPCTSVPVVLRINANETN